MTGKDILEKIFDMSFVPGHYYSQMQKIDAMGMIGKKQQLEILLKFRLF